MGLDPLTHEPYSHSHTTKPPASPATRHMAQWESARLEAEARLSRESSILGAQPLPPHLHHPTKMDSDYFLRLWNSEVGDSFRNVMAGGDHKPACSHSPTSQASSSTKCCSVSAVTTDQVSPNLMGFSASMMASGNQNEEMMEYCKSCKSNTEEAVDGSDSSSSIDDMEDCSDTALQLLLDFPINNDMSFLEEGNNSHDEYYATAPASMFMENSFICPL